MGSSKKHKEKDREHKRKRKHRSRSRERTHKRPKERDLYEEVDDRRGRDRDLYEEVEDKRVPDYGDYYDHDREEGELEEEYKPNAKSSGGDISLSIEETNKLRAKLGLKPLEVTGGSQGQQKESLKDDIHVPAKNISQVKETERLRERLETTKDKRRINEKLGKIKTLGDSDSDEDAATWVRRNRMKQREKEKAEKTAKLLEEMDAEFGISSLVEKEFKPKEKKYTSRDLKGLKVEHDMNAFEEGKSVILTLKDRGILDDEDEAETLINVNMVDAEKALRNVENKKKKPDYNPYDDAEEDEYGMFKAKEVLSKYDEEIEGQRKKKFELGAGGSYNAEEDRQLDRIKDQLRASAQTLSTNVTLATEYLTAEEAAAKFKKVKKKVRKIRAKKMLKADDLLPQNGNALNSEDFGSRSRGRGAAPVTEDSQEGFSDPNQSAMDIPGLTLVPQPPPPTELPPPQSPDLSGSDMDVDSSDDDVEIDEDLTGIVIEDEAEMELQSALSKAIKVKQKKDRKDQDKIAEKIVLENRVKKEPDSPTRQASIVLNATSEFCRALGDIPTYGQAGNRDEIEKDELVEFEKELLEQRRRREEEEPTGWNRVEIDETPVNLEGEEKPVLEDEPVMTTGIAAALKVAVNKGFLEHEKIKLHKKVKNKQDLEAQNYSIEDKRYDDLDEKYKKRDRYSGMLQEFKEKEGYKPDFKLEYIDDSGRNLNQKEAFRQLSHRFHGKGSGKKKTEKRSKKLEEENLMKRMSSTDTPLNTVELLRQKQTQEKTPYIVLSGNKGFTYVAGMLKICMKKYYAQNMFPDKITGILT